MCRFSTEPLGARFGSMILSVLYILCGFFIAATPVSSASAATLLLGFLFLSSGVVKAIIYTEAKFGGKGVALHHLFSRICLGFIYCHFVAVNSGATWLYGIGRAHDDRGNFRIAWALFYAKMLAKERKLPSAPAEEFTAEEQAIETKKKHLKNLKKPRNTHSQISRRRLVRRFFCLQQTTYL